MQQYPSLTKLLLSNNIDDVALFYDLSVTWSGKKPEVLEENWWYSKSNELTHSNLSKLDNLIKLYLQLIYAEMDNVVIPTVELKYLLGIDGKDRIGYSYNDLEFTFKSPIQIDIALKTHEDQFIDLNEVQINLLDSDFDNKLKHLELMFHYMMEHHKAKQNFRKIIKSGQHYLSNCSFKSLEQDNLFFNLIWNIGFNNEQVNEDIANLFKKCENHNKILCSSFMGFDNKQKGVAFIEIVYHSNDSQTNKIKLSIHEDNTQCSISNDNNSLCLVISNITIENQLIYTDNYTIKQQNQTQLTFQDVFTILDSLINE